MKGGILRALVGYASLFIGMGIILGYYLCGIAEFIVAACLLICAYILLCKYC